MNRITKIRATLTALPPNLRGTLWMLCSAVLFTVMATLVKVLGARLDSFEVAFFRSLTAIIVIFPLILRHGREGFYTRRPWLHLLRGTLGSLGMMCGFYAFVHLPLATASAISFSRTLFLVPLAYFILRESVGYRRLAATLVGFIGVMIILRPTAQMDGAALVAVISALVIAGAVTCVKVLAREDGPMILLFTSSLIGIVVTAIPASLNWVLPSLGEFLGLALMGAFGVAAQSCFIRAYSIGEVSALAPVDYTRLIFATGVGFFLFANVPDLWVFFGSAVIVASTLYITLREARVKPASSMLMAIKSEENTVQASDIRLISPENQENSRKNE
jgi:drug/metabolite transporter (DMT)-like permease